MLLLYRIYTILSSISGIVQFSEYDGLHKYQTYGTFQTFQTTQPPGFSAVVPIFQRQKVDHRRLYYASEKLKAVAYIAAAEEGKTYIIYINVVNYSRRSITGQFSPKTSKGTTKQKHDEPHNRVILGRNMKHPAARKRACKRTQHT